jgi:hypothetical protein
MHKKNKTLFNYSVVPVDSMIIILKHKVENHFSFSEVTDYVKVDYQIRIIIKVKNIMTQIFFFFLSIIDYYALTNKIITLFLADYSTKRHSCHSTSCWSRSIIDSSTNWYSTICSANLFLNN